MANQFEQVLRAIGERTLDIIKQPLIHKEMLWILLPLLVTLLIMEIYFGRYKREELGWNSAVSNSLVLFFVGMNLASFLYANNLLVGLRNIQPEFIDIAIKKTLITLVIVLESIFLVTLDFFHLVPKSVAFGVSSETMMNYVGILSIILVYSNAAIDLITVPAILLIFIVFVLFFWTIRFIEPKVLEEEE